MQDERVYLRRSGYATYICTYAYKRSTGEWTMVNSNSFNFSIPVNTIHMGAANNFLSRKSTRINIEKTWQRNIWPNLRNITIICRKNYVDVS